MRTFDMEMNSEKAIVIITALILARVQLGSQHCDIPTVDSLIGNFHNVLAVCQAEESKAEAASEEC